MGRPYSMLCQCLIDAEHCLVVTRRVNTAPETSTNEKQTMYHLREYQDRDLAGVLSSWENASRIAHTFVNETFLDEERHNIPTIYLPNADTWVVEKDGRVMGFIALIGNEVGALFVEPEIHGAGAGKQLMDKARELHGDLEVQVFEDNEIGRAFYSRYGFKLMNERVCERTGFTLLRLKYVADS